jgi:DNA-binding NarL/FixJ family response regulator
MIADNDPLILESLKLSFSQHDTFEVVGLIADGADAVDMCKTIKPDVVLLDARLDGVATTQQIKAFCPNVRVIISTVFGSTSDVQKAIEAGADGYIDKIDIIKKFYSMLYKCEKL